MDSSLIFIDKGRREELWKRGTTRPRSGEGQAEAVVESEVQLKPGDVGRKGMLEATTRIYG